MEVFPVRTTQRHQFVDITDQVQRCVAHTTAGVTINENADPDVVYDLLNTLAGLVPERAGYRHVEGNSDSHVKSSLIAPSLMLIVENGRLKLGTWQAVYFAEFDGPRNRQCWVKRVG